MKHLAAILAACVAFVPASVLAQTSPPEGPPPPPPQWRGHDNAAFHEIPRQIEQLHRAERAKMLAALTPAHKALLANIVGQLAVSSNPDRKAAGARFDAALSSGEKQAILSVHKSTMSQEHAIMEKARAQFEASLPADQRNRMQHEGPWMQEFHKMGNPSAGQIALMVASGRGPNMFFRMRGPMHGPRQGPPPPPMAPAPATT